MLNEKYINPTNFFGKCYLFLFRKNAGGPKEKKK